MDLSSWLAGVWRCKILELSPVSSFMRIEQREAPEMEVGNLHTPLLSIIDELKKSKEGSGKRYLMRNIGVWRAAKEFSSKSVISNEGEDST